MAFIVMAYVAMADRSAGESESAQILLGGVAVALLLTALRRSGVGPK